MNKQQLSYTDVQALSYEQLGAIEDPMVLMATSQLSPLLVRYVVRTGQLAHRFRNTPVPVLLDAVGRAAAAHGTWPYEVSQAAPLGQPSKAVDAYLDAIGALPPLSTFKAVAAGT